MDSAAYFDKVAKELGQDSFINRTDNEVECDLAFNCESAPHFITGKKLTFIYHIDPTWNHANNISHRMPDCDLIFSTHKDVPYKDDPKFRYLPHAAYDGWYTGEEKQYDIFLPPSPPSRQDRRELSEKLAAKYNTTTVPYGTPTEEYIKEMRKCRIIFNLSGRGDLNRKIFDGMLHGVLVTNELKELPLIGEKGKHYFTFKDDPIPLLDNLLSDYDTLSKVDHESTQLVLHNHTYTHRVMYILDCMKEMI